MPCTRETETCPVTHDYTPLNECCKRIVLNTLQYLCQKLEENDIHYWLDYGTLLGATRDEKFIPWDRDADIGILETGLQRFKSLFPQFIEDGYNPTSTKLENGLESCHYQLYASKINDRHVCIFSWYQDGEMLRRSNYIGLRSEVGTDAKKGGDFPFDWVEERSQINFEGQSYWAPLNTIRMCKHRYGDKWKNPLNIGDWNRTDKLSNLYDKYNSPKFSDKLEIAQVLTKYEIDAYVKIYSKRLCNKPHINVCNLTFTDKTIFDECNIILFKDFKEIYIENFEYFLDDNLIPYKILAKTENHDTIVLHIL